MPERKIIKICYSSRFAKTFKGLPKQQKMSAVRKEGIFRANVFDPRLKTHKLHGKLKNQWSFAVSRKYRIVFMFIKENEALFLDVGDHKIYQ